MRLTMRPERRKSRPSRGKATVATAMADGRRERVERNDRQRVVKAWRDGYRYMPYFFLRQAEDERLQQSKKIYIIIIIEERNEMGGKSSLLRPVKFTIHFR